MAALDGATFFLVKDKDCPGENPSPAPPAPLLLGIRSEAQAYPSSAKDKAKTSDRDWLYESGPSEEQNQEKIYDGRCIIRSCLG